MIKKWNVKSPIDSTTVEQFRSDLKINATLSTLLLQRGISTFHEAKAFFRPSLDDLHDPFLMKNMLLAVNRLQKAIDHQENILLFGDYDVDGTTAVSLMYSFLGEYYGHLFYYIPDRFKEGYGMSNAGVDYAKENNCTLIITLDCGIRNIDCIAYAKTLGIDAVVCDHHEPGDELPDAIILDPKQSDCSYPYSELCGAGVAFKFLQAWCEKSNIPKENLFLQLDRVAVAIGADIVPVTGENRILAFHGLRLLNNEKRYCYKILVDKAKRSFPLTLTDVVFTIAPRINAIGRLEHGKKAVELMLAQNDQDIKTIAGVIEEANVYRRELDADILEEALEKIKNDPFYQTSKSTIIYQPDWHKGVLGIVASRLIEQSFKPTIVLTKHDGILTGSARSINTFNIFEALTACEDLLLQFGGHQFAAGLSLLPENFNAFREKFDEVCQNRLSNAEMIPVEQVDTYLEFNQLFEKDESRTHIPKFKRILSQMEPHGPGNMKPQFLTTNVFAESIFILQEKHLKLKVCQSNSDVVLEAIGFNMADKLDMVADGVAFDLLYTLEVNAWKNSESLQLNIKDIRPTL